MFCHNCLGVGFCRRWRSVANEELGDPTFIVDARNSIHLWMEENDCEPSDLIDRLLDEISHLDGNFRDASGAVDPLAWETFEVKCNVLFQGTDEASKVRGRITDWLGYQFGQLWPLDTQAKLYDPYSRERFRTIASATRAVAWDRSDVQLWGVRPANDR